MRRSYEMSISEENEEVVQIINSLKANRINVSDQLCKYIINGHERMLKTQVEKDMIIQDDTV